MLTLSAAGQASAVGTDEGPTAGVLLSGRVHSRGLPAAHVEGCGAQRGGLPKAEATVAPPMRRPVGEVDVAARSSIPYHDGGMARTSPPLRTRTGVETL